MKKVMSLLLVMLLALTVFTACSPAEKVGMDVAMLKGPTGFGSVELMKKAEEGKTANNYNFTLAGSPEEIKASIINGEFEIAALPTNVAATLYHKANADIQIMAINTLGTLYVVTKGVEIKSMADLKGQEIFATGQGAMPQYVTEYLLKENNIDPEKDVTVTYLGEHAALATKVLESKEPIIAVLPQPFVTQVTMNDQNVKTAVDMTEEWNKVTNGESVLSMGCVVVNKTFAQKNPAAVKAFLDEYKASIEYTNNNPAEAAKLIEKYGIAAKAALAQKAIPGCHATFIDGTEMKEKLGGLFDVLYAANPASIGGKIPDDAFYYTK